MTKFECITQSISSIEYEVLLFWNIFDSRTQAPQLQLKYKTLENLTLNKLISFRMTK